MTYLNVFFLEKQCLHALTPLPHLVCMVLWICKWAPPPLTHSEIHWLIWMVVCDVRNTSVFLRLSLVQKMMLD